MTNQLKTSFKRMSHTAAQKLKIIQYAEEHGNRPAARHFGVSESCVRLWRKKHCSSVKFSKLARDVFFLKFLSKHLCS